MNPTKPTVILENYRQAFKVRLVFWFLLACGVAALWGGWVIFQTYGLSQADGGVLRPLWQRAAFGGFVASLGLVFAGGMWLYISVYALHISRVGKQVHITTMTPFGSRKRQFQVSDIGQSAYYHGRVPPLPGSSTAAGIWVNAPWMTLRARGHRLPFVIDMQAELLDLNVLDDLD